MVSVLVLLLSLFAGVASADTEPNFRPTTTGFYPLWENTGYVDKSGDIYIGTGSAHVGILDRANVGVSPLLFGYRMPNGFAKIRIWDYGDFHLSGQASLYQLLPGAGQSSMSPDYASRVDNPDFPITVLPLSLATTWHLGSVVDLHQTLTGVEIFGHGGVDNSFSMAYSAVSELFPEKHHSLNFHFMYVGLWNYDNAVLGTSYRYRNDWSEVRFGYFYRIRKAGTQGGPLISLALLL